MLKKKYHIVGIGEILWDLLPDGKHLGGAPANFAYHASILGAKSYIASCVGNDVLGREIINKLNKMGLNSKYIDIDRAHSTGISVIKLDQEQKPIFDIQENVSWDFMSTDTGLLDLAPNVDAVCFGSLCQRSIVSRTTIQQFLQKTRPDCIKIFDINFRQSYYAKEIVISSLELANLLKLNVEELLILAQMLSLSGSQIEMLEYLANFFQIDLIILTKDSKGSILYTKNGTSIHPGFAVKVLDTVGAGDAFAAAVVMGWIQNYDINTINETANRLGSYVCTQFGAMPLIPKKILKTLYK